LNPIAWEKTPMQRLSLKNQVINWKLVDRLRFFQRPIMPDRFRPTISRLSRTFRTNHAIAVNRIPYSVFRKQKKQAGPVVGIRDP
jgi:hypothetical protein